jgi:hypothetical protein
MHKVVSLPICRLSSLWSVCTISAKSYEKKGKVVNVFKFKNMGKAPVAITEVNTWCGCVAANYTKKAVRPGETAMVTVTFDPDHKSGNFVKQVVLLLNDGRRVTPAYG